MQPQGTRHTPFTSLMICGIRSEVMLSHWRLALLVADFSVAARAAAPPAAATAGGRHAAQENATAQGIRFLFLLAHGWSLLSRDGFGFRDGEILTRAGGGRARRAGNGRWTAGSCFSTTSGPSGGRRCPRISYPACGNGASGGTLSPCAVCYHAVQTQRRKAHRSAFLYPGCSKRHQRFCSAAIVHADADRRPTGSVSLGSAAPGFRRSSVRPALDRPPASASPAPAA